MTWPTAVPDPAAVARAAEILNAGEKVAILIGQGARGAAAQVLAVADLLGAGIAKALLGKDVLPDDLAYVTGSIGLLGTRPSYEMMRDCDTLLTVGSNFPYTQFLPGLDTARAIQIDVDGAFIGMRYPYELNMVADASAALDALIPLLERKTDRSWRDTIEAGVADWWEVMERRAHSDAPPVNPQRLFAELNDRSPDDMIVTGDSGSAANWYARQIRFREGQRGSLSGTLATMGNAVPYAIGAKFAHPDRVAIAFEGDGAMQMNGMAELLTVKRYYHEWSDPRLIVAVLHNNDLNQVTWEMRGMEGDPKLVESQSLPEVSYADFAAGIGLNAITVTDPDAVGPAWDAALAADRPTVLDVHCNADVPPIPPHATLEQIRNSAAAIFGGDEDAVGVIKTGIKEKLQELVPRKSR